MSKHKLFCIVGRSAVGKSTIARELEKRYGLKTLKSYTTREQRGPDDIDHIFVGMPEYATAQDIVAETKINGNYYWATKQQLLESDVYIIDPRGLVELTNKLSPREIDLVVIYVTCNKRDERAATRGDNPESYMARSADENAQFTAIEEAEWYDYKVDTSVGIEDTMTQLMLCMNEAADMLLYTIPGCPHCEELKKLLTERGLVWVEMQCVAPFEENNWPEAPVLRVPTGEVGVGLTKAIKLMKDYLGEID